MGKKKKNAGPRVSKNPNEYWEGEKLFVKTIKRSVCIEKHNNTYVLCCRIHQRGERQFDYQESACLLKAGNKSLYLTPTARQTIEAAVARFNAQIEEARNFYTKVDVEELGEYSVEALAEYKATGFASEYYSVDSTLIDINNISSIYSNDEEQ